MVKKARTLKKTLGVFAEPTTKKGKDISDETIKVIAFFESDEYSRICPVKKDYLSVKISGKRVHKQNRLLLANLHELYAFFKEKLLYHLQILPTCINKILLT